VTAAFDVDKMNLREGGWQSRLRLGIVHHQSTLPATLIATGNDGCNELQLFRGWFKNAGASGRVPGAV
jgi:hypothetical protein